MKPLLNGGVGRNDDEVVDVPAQWVDKGRLLSINSSGDDNSGWKIYKLLYGGWYKEAHPLSVKAVGAIANYINQVASGGNGSGGGGEEGRRR